MKQNKYIYDVGSLVKGILYDDDKSSLGVVISTRNLNGSVHVYWFNRYGFYNWQSAAYLHDLKLV